MSRQPISKGNCSARTARRARKSERAKRAERDRTRRAMKTSWVSKHEKDDEIRLCTHTPPVFLTIASFQQSHGAGGWAAAGGGYCHGVFQRRAGSRAGDGDWQQAVGTVMASSRREQAAGQGNEGWAAAGGGHCHGVFEGRAGSRAGQAMRTGSVAALLSVTPLRVSCCTCRISLLSHTRALVLAGVRRGTPTTGNMEARKTADLAVVGAALPMRHDVSEVPAPDLGRALVAGGAPPTAAPVHPCTRQELLAESKFHFLVQLYSDSRAALSCFFCPEKRVLSVSLPEKSN